MSARRQDWSVGILKLIGSIKNKLSNTAVTTPLIDSGRISTVVGNTSR